MSRHVALLRGINVGGKNKLPMADLRDLLEAAGAKDVRTYIQSGNVVFDGTAALAKRLPKALTAAIADRFGYDVPVVVRGATAFADLVAANPFPADADPKTVQVGFLGNTPSAAKVKALDPERSPGDRFEVIGAQIYVHCPNGMARTKLTNVWFDRQLGAVSTFRNWRTTLKLLEMCRA